MQAEKKQELQEWQSVKFGDVAQEVKTSTKDPLGDGLERYIGLEHIDSESLQITRWGSIKEDNPTFTKKFKAGQILFGRRRAYLKKAAVPDFDGICSGDIIVIEPNGDDMLPELLPFIVQSDVFFAWAVKHSAGGLSPRTKFKSLAKFEFVIPSQRQEALVSILKKIEYLLRKIENLIKCSDKMLEVLYQELISGKRSEPKTHLLSIIEVSKVIASSVNKKSVAGERAVKLCNYMDVYSNRKITKDLPFMDATATENQIKKFGLTEGDVVITKDSEDPSDIAIPAYISENIEKLVCGYHLAILRPHLSLINGKYLFYTLNNKWARHRFSPFAQGITRFGIVSQAYRKIKIYCPNKDTQNHITSVLDSAYALRDTIFQKKGMYVNLQKKIVQQILTDDLRRDALNAI